MNTSIPKKPPQNGLPYTTDAAAYAVIDGLLQQLDKTHLAMTQHRKPKVHTWDIQDMSSASAADCPWEYLAFIATRRCIAPLQFAAGTIWDTVYCRFLQTARTAENWMIHVCAVHQLKYSGNGITGQRTAADAAVIQELTTRQQRLSKVVTDTFRFTFGVNTALFVCHLTPFDVNEEPAHSPQTTEELIATQLKWIDEYPFRRTVFHAVTKENTSRITFDPPEHKRLSEQAAKWQKEIVTAVKAGQNFGQISRVLLRCEQATKWQKEVANTVKAGRDIRHLLRPADVDFSNEIENDVKRGRDIIQPCPSEVDLGNDTLKNSHWDLVKYCMMGSVGYGYENRQFFNERKPDYSEPRSTQEKSAEHSNTYEGSFAAAGWNLAKAGILTYGLFTLWGGGNHDNH